MKKFEAIILLGRGVYMDESIPESAMCAVKDAVDFYNQKVTEHIIFSGKWSYKIDFTPPLTEAQAMANYAIKLGLPEEAITIEDESNTTVSNCYYIKKNILEPNNWKNVLLIGIKPQHIRAFFNLEYVLGHDYKCEVIPANYSFPPEKHKILEKIEIEKMIGAKKLFEPFKPGDHEAIYEAAKKDLEENYK